MRYRQTDGVALAAARAGFSTAAGYRLEQELHLPSSPKPPRGLRQHNLSLGQLADELLRLVVPRHPSPPSCQNLKQILDHSEGGGVTANHLLRHVGEALSPV